MKTNIISKSIVAALATMMLTTPLIANDIFGNKRIKASGKITSHSYNVKSFNKIEVSSMAKVVIKEGSGEIELKVDSNLFPYIEIHVEGGELIIGVQNGITTGNDMTFDVIVPHSGKLQAIDISGAAHITSQVVITNPEIELESSGAAQAALLFKCDDCTIDASGASQINIGIESKVVEIEASGASDIEAYIKATNLTADVSGASNLTLKGEAQKAQLEASGASDIDAKSFNTSTINIISSGAASISSNRHNKGELGQSTKDIDINSSGSSDILASINTNNCTIYSSGASTVTIKGAAHHMDIEATGASRINAKELTASSVQSTCSAGASISLNKATNDHIVE